jgi:hypothetical protein
VRFEDARHAQNRLEPQADQLQMQELYLQDVRPVKPRELTYHFAHSIGRPLRSRFVNNIPRLTMGGHQLSSTMASAPPKLGDAIQDM